MSVCRAIDSTPGHHKVLRPVSLGPVGVQSEKNFLEKRPVE
jgi:hypothetical protein